MDEKDNHHETLPHELAALQPHRHVCCFYRTHAELEKLWVPFMVEGLKRRQKCVLVVGEDYSIDQAAHALTAAGVDVQPHFADSSLAIADSTGFPTSSDVRADEVIAFWVEKLEAACNEGFASVRVAAQMTWLTYGQREQSVVAEYEFLGNKLFTHLPMSALCLYDQNIFSQSQCEKVAAAHPHVAQCEDNSDPKMSGATEFLVRRAFNSGLTTSRAITSTGQYLTATSLLHAEQYVDAERLFKEAVEAETGIVRISAMLGLIEALRGQARYAEADSLEEEATNLLLKR